MASGFVVHAGDGQAAPGAGGSVLATAAATDGAFSLLLSHAPPGDGAPLHVHRDESESFFVRAGTYRIWFGDDTFEAGVQDFVYLPRGVPHAWRVVSEMAGRKLILAVPRRRRLPGSNWAVPSRWIAGRGNLGRTLIRASHWDRGS